MLLNVTTSFSPLPFAPQVMFVHHRLPSRHLEPRVVGLHHPHRSAQLHGGKRSHPRQHRDLGLRGEGETQSSGM